MKKICVIPARMGSSRFPGKPLALAHNIPLVIHVAKRCSMNKSFDRVVVATCDQEIVNACNKFKIESVMTSEQHERCTDRVSEAILNLKIYLDDHDFVLMVQGDEILVTPAMLQKVIDDYLQMRAPAINLLSSIKNMADYHDPNVVKVVANPLGNALYLSRAPIPSNYRTNDVGMFQQTGVIGFKASFLQQYSKMPQTSLEKTESIDMLRILEHGLILRVVYTDDETIAVDVPGDLERAIQVLAKDTLLEQYA